VWPVREAGCDFSAGVGSGSRARVKCSSLAVSSLAHLCVNGLESCTISDVALSCSELLRVF
jgi:hypothetical protein